jgi:DNA-binding Lrp family transcriptional regulator
MQKRSETVGVRRLPKAENNRTKMAEFVKQVEEVGSNINEVARRMGMFKETARYWYRWKFVEKGIGLGASVDYKALGFKRLLVISRVNREYRPLVQELFLAMDNKWYVTGYIGTIPDDTMIIHITVPEEKTEEFLGFMYDLRDKLHFFSEIEILNTDWFRNVPMQAEYYDFDHGRWDFEWSSIKDPPGLDEMTERPVTSKLDLTDLMVLGKLQRDANMSLVDVSRKLKISYKKVLRHRKHLDRRGAIAGFRVHWIKTSYNEKERRNVTRKHAYLFETVIVAGLNDSESRRVLSDLRRLPFTWSIGGGGSSVYVDYAIPLELVNEAFGYIRQVLGVYNERMRHFTTDQNDSVFFTIPYKLYNGKTKQWEFDKDETFAQFKAELQKLSHRAVPQ